MKCRIPRFMRVVCLAALVGCLDPWQRAAFAETAAELERSVNTVAEALVAPRDEFGAIRYTFRQSSSRPPVRLAEPEDEPVTGTVVGLRATEVAALLNAEYADGVRSFERQVWWAPSLRRTDQREIYTDQRLMTDNISPLQSFVNLRRVGFSRFTGWWAMGRSVQFYTDPAAGWAFEEVQHLPFLFPEEGFSLAVLVLRAPPGPLPDPKSYAGWAVDPTKVAGLVAGAVSGTRVRLDSAGAGQALVLEFTRDAEAGGDAEVRYELSPPGTPYPVAKVLITSRGSPASYVSTRVGVRADGFPERFSRTRTDARGEQEEVQIALHESPVDRSFNERAVFLPTFPADYEVVVLEWDQTITDVQVPDRLAGMPRAQRWSAELPDGDGNSIVRTLKWVALGVLVSLALLGVFAVRRLRMPSLSRGIPTRRG